MILVERQNHAPVRLPWIIRPADCTASLADDFFGSSISFFIFLSGESIGNSVIEFITSKASVGEVSDGFESSVSVEVIDLPC